MGQKQPWPWWTAQSRRDALACSDTGGHRLNVCEELILNAMHLDTEPGGGIRSSGWSLHECDWHLYKKVPETSLSNSAT